MMHECKRSGGARTALREFSSSGVGTSQRYSMALTNTVKVGQVASWRWDAQPCVVHWYV